MTRERLFKLVFKHDIYTRHFVRPEYRTVEHIVPNRILPSPHAKKDIVNLFVADRVINRFRSDYRFGGSFEEILSTSKDWEHLSYKVFRNRKKRIFFPLYGRRIVANTCLEMLRRYPVLHDYKDQFMHEIDTKEWLYEHLDDTDRFTLFLKSRFN